jgi:thioredoxin-related protein
MNKPGISGFLIAALSLLLMSFTWRTDFDKAQSDAAAQHKMIILKFSGSDWCIPCIRMEKTIFNTPAFHTFADRNLIMINADYPRLKKNQPSKDIAKQNDQLASIYNKDGHFPLTLLLSADGKVMKKWDGYSGAAPADFIAQIKNAGK